MENEINDFIHPLGARVKHVNTAACQLAESSEGERFQHVVVTVWYD